MREYVIYQDATGVELWAGAAEDELAALDAYAQEAGCDNYASTWGASVGDDDGVRIIERTLEGEIPGRPGKDYLPRRPR